MKHFGIITPPVSGHIHPFAALGRELIARGHRVTCLQAIDLEEKIHSEEIDFEPIGLSDHPRGTVPASLAQIGRLKGLAALKFTIGEVARASVAVCRDAPDAIRRRGIDALLVDQTEPAGGAVAEHLGLPFVTVCNALALNRDPIAPPPFTGWRYRKTHLARARNAIGYAASDWLTLPIARVVQEHRAKWNLMPLSSTDDSFSKLAQICQMPRELDFPRVRLPETFHYVGPLRRRRASAVAFPWERLNGRPIIYASLGTLQNSREPVFRCFAEACRGLDVQLVLSHGGGLTDAQAAALPGNPLVVSYAPQEELLGRARLTLTHAGLNTVLDSLTNNVPLVMVPITYEQPAIARRVESAGAGQSISMRRLESHSLRSLLERVFNESSYKSAAARVGSGIAQAGGVKRAADIVEAATRS